MWPDARRRFAAKLATAVLLACSWTAPARAAAFDLAALTQVLASVKSGEATFTEKRQVAMLDKPQESSGVMSFSAPDTFVRETLKPRKERIAVIGNVLTMSQGLRSRSLELDSAPEAAVMVEAIRGTLTGNREALEKHFTTSVSGSADQWLLEMIPRESRLRQQVSLIQVSGRQAYVREINVLLPDGDRSITTVEPVTAGSAASAASGAR